MVLGGKFYDFSPAMESWALRLKEIFELGERAESEDSRTVEFFSLFVFPQNMERNMDPEAAERH